MTVSTGRATRAAALLSAGLLALGLVPAPASAAGEGPSAAELRAMAPALPSSVPPRAAPGEDRRLDVVTDRRGDAERTGLARGPRPYTRLADLTRLRYKTPSRDGGDLRVTNTWADLRDASRPAVRRQIQVTYLDDVDDDGFWAFVVTNADDRIRLYDLTEDFDRVRPDKVRVQRTFGPGGTTDVLMSTEWLDADRVRFFTQGISGSGEEALDRVRRSRPLDVGALR
ncbi:hypothetical protein [Nocardioides sp. CFH 31398]|uniref:hypothetical protein n=1 Tax=Nocardioides sp. CFH 31398 TaxID=2919579 RepID=UPI001F0625DA|nr:hypothetical protein [Nocardioides sp. CFH 31398]MCH1865390.1 hypothetical protein [Nocardioides sp. CFH 31398]